MEERKDFHLLIDRSNFSDVLVMTTVDWAAFTEVIRPTSVPCWGCRRLLNQMESVQEIKKEALNKVWS
jgi:hypothetical protein